jgi:CheY-like chemotaxis protein/HPt (histidine-containing phosphotransfer) domain-containing protein
LIDSPDAVQDVLHETRARFSATFAEQCAALRGFIDEVEAQGPAGPVDTLTQAAHRLTGLAGTIGFPTISARAAELEALVAGVGDGTVDALRARVVVDAMEEAFVTDLPNQPPQAAPAVGPVFAARTVVIAEDDPDVIRIVGAQFRAIGYRTVLALDGAQAVTAVRAHAPDALVLDLMMPALSGFDVLTAIRESPGPHPRIVVLSARGREADVARAFELGADDYMTKPFNPQELTARIARLVA